MDPQNDPNYISQERARELINHHLDNPNGPYLDLLNRHTPQQRARAVHEVNVLYQIANGMRSTATGFVNEFEEQKKDDLRATYGQGVLDDKKSHNSVTEQDFYPPEKKKKEPNLMENPPLNLADELKRLYG